MDTHKDMVNHPIHYNANGLECIDVMQLAYGDENVSSFCKLNAFKYLYRADKKGGLEDMKKARWYLDKYIQINEENV